MTELTCNNLSVGYEGRAVAQNINFSIESGDYLCVVGENGSGKSTLMKTILGLQKPLKGEIEYFNDVKPTQIGYIPQQTEIQKDFPASVFEIVISGCLSECGFFSFYSRKQKNLAREKMKLLGIENFEKRCYRELSGGQQQRVLLARALCSAKRMLLLDEPVAGLDPIVTQELYDIIEKLNKEQRLTVIMISHDISAALKYANRILYVGKQTFFGSNEDFMKSSLCKHIVSEAE